MKLPSFQFYPGDWRKDPNLARCSKAAKGLWIDLLCLMFECEERGKLMSNGKPWSDEDIAVAIGGHVTETMSCLNELIDKGVAQRDNLGCVYSRRMVRDEKLRNEHAKRQDEYRKRVAVHSDAKSDARSDMSVTSMCHPSSSSSSSSASSSKIEKDVGPPKVAETLPFDDFYELFPKKKARKDAESAWSQVWTKKILTREVWENVAKPALLAQKECFDWKKDGGAYVPLPATWLRGRRWEDEVTSSPKQANETLMQEDIERRRRMREYADKLIASNAHNRL